MDKILQLVEWIPVDGKQIDEQAYFIYDPKYGIIRIAMYHNFHWYNEHHHQLPNPTHYAIITDPIAQPFQVVMPDANALCHIMRICADQSEGSELTHEELLSRGFQPSKLCSQPLTIRRCMMGTYYDAAIAAIDRLFGDTSVDAAETLMLLIDLISHIEVCVNALESDQRKLEKGGA